MRAAPAERLEVVLTAARAGESMAAIGRRLGLTRERVRQIIKAAGYRIADLKPPKPAPPPRAVCANCGAVLRMPASDRERWCGARPCRRARLRQQYQSDPDLRARHGRNARAYQWRKRYGAEPPAEVLAAHEVRYCVNCGGQLKHTFVPGSPRRARYCMKPECRKAFWRAKWVSRADPALIAAREQARGRRAEQQRLRVEAAERRRQEQAAREARLAQQRQEELDTWGPLIAQAKRGALPYSQRELARRLGMKRSTLQGILTGVRRPYLQAGEGR